MALRRAATPKDRARGDCLLSRRLVHTALTARACRNASRTATSTHHQPGRNTMAKQRLTQDTPFLRTPDMYQIENDAPITEYADATLDLIADTVNCGIPDGANAFCSVGKEKRGTVQMQLFARINPDTETFEEVGFRSHGCLAAIGCAALLANKLPGKTFEQALAITKEELDEELGGLPKSRIYTLVFGIEAVRALIGDYCLRIKGYSLAQLTQEIPCDYMCVNCLLTENCSLRDERVDQEMRELGEIE